MLIDVEAILKQPFTANDARDVHAKFADKIKEVEDIAAGDIAKLAGKLWVLFSSPKVPASVKVAVGVALAYFILPVDIIPDTTVVIGYLDDVAVMSYVLNRIGMVVAVAKTGREHVRRNFLRT